MSESRSTDLFDGWCYSEMTPYSMEQLGTEAWLTGCPLCGSSDCGRDVTPEQKAEVDAFFSRSDMKMSDADNIMVDDIVNGDGTVDPKNFKSRWLYRYVRFADGRVLFCDGCSILVTHKTIADAYTDAPPVSAGKIEVRGKEWRISESGSTTLKLQRFDSDEKYIARELGPKFRHE